MKITGITRVKGTRYRVEVDGEYWNILDAEVLADFGFQPGLEVGEEALVRALEQAERRRARERAFYLLSSRDYSAGELLEKLSKNVSEEVALQTVVRMQELGLVNDVEYAGKLARSLLTVKRYGAFRAKQEMRRRHLSDEIIDAALEEAAFESDPLEPLRELIEKKYRRNLDTPEGRKKTIAALMRLGHSYSNIRQVLDEYPAAEADEQEWEE